MNINQMHLKHVEQRIQATDQNIRNTQEHRRLDPSNSDIYDHMLFQYDNEAVRLSFALSDVLSRLSQKEIDEYEQSKAYVPTEAELKRQREDDRRAMNENKDRPSV